MTVRRDHTDIAMTRTKRQASAGSWKPGQSGNPKGRPRTGMSLAERVRALVDPDEMIAAMLAIARDKKKPDATRMAAWGWLADRGFQRPPAPLQIESTHQVDVSVGLSLDRVVSALDESGLRALELAMGQLEGAGVHLLSDGDGGSEH
jgi:hypothetical protein